MLGIAARRGSTIMTTGSGMGELLLLVALVVLLIWACQDEPY
jgi:hypothetical protein